MMKPSAEKRLLDGTATTIEQSAHAAYEKMMRLISQGVSPQVALKQATNGFKGAFTRELTEAFSKILQASVGEASVLGMKIGHLTLSKKLYRETQAINATVLNLINSHTKGFDQARTLTMKIFEGYGFKASEVLRLSPGTPGLPKYLRDELLIDPGVQGELSRLLARAQALRLKTPALKAAYLEYLDAIEEGVGAELLEKKVQQAYYERMRYFANRIAQTELHRAYALTNARELIADTDVEWVQYRLSKSHPRMDICDLFAKRDVYGMGPGVYPKGLCPLAPIHPHCRCIVAPRLDIHTPSKKAKAKPYADQAYLSGLTERQAAMVMGNKFRAQAVLSGRDGLEIFNMGKDPTYLVRPMGEAVHFHGLIVPKPTPKPRAKATPKPKAVPVPKASPAPAPKPKTLDDFITLGSEKLLRLPSPARDQRAFFLELFKQLGEDVGTSQACNVSATTMKAMVLVQDASKRFPNSWTAVSDRYANTLKAEIVTRRASYDPLRCRISTRDEFLPALHEFSHHLQAVMPELDDYFQELHSRRTAGQALEEMADLEPFDGYPRGEVTRKDNYARAYQGREYAWSKGREALEVLPVAFQTVLGYTPENDIMASAALRATYKQDREMIELALGLLFGWTP
jgi:hypothetical protein